MPPQVKEIYDAPDTACYYFDGHGFRRTVSPIDPCPSCRTRGRVYSQSQVDSIISLYEEARRWVPVEVRLPEDYPIPIGGGAFEQSKQYVCRLSDERVLLCFWYPFYRSGYWVFDWAYLYDAVHIEPVTELDVTVVQWLSLPPTND